MSEESSEFKGVIRFTYKSLTDHIKDYLKLQALSLLITFCTIFGILFTFIQAIEDFDSLQASERFMSVFWLSGTSLLIGISWHLRKYVNSIPEGLENISGYACKIAQLQRPKWQFHFAKSLLAQALSPLDKEMKDLEDDKIFLTLTKHKGAIEYLDWLGSVVENNHHMIEIAKNIIFNDVAVCLASDLEKPVQPLEVRESIQTVVLYYQSLIEYEKSILQVYTPDEIKEAHRLLLGCTFPMRDAVHQLFLLLQKFYDSNFEDHINFTIAFSEPKSIAEATNKFTELNVFENQQLLAKW